MSKEILYYYSLVCPKCIRPSRWIKELADSNPEITIKKIKVGTNIKQAKEQNIRNLPTIIIGESRLEGRISKEEFDEAIKKL